MEEKELIDKLYEKIKVKAEEVKPTSAQKLKKFLREYFGLFPMIGGVIFAGASSIIAYGIGVVHGIYNGVKVSSLYEYASVFAGKIVVPSSLFGQFFFYKLGKNITSIFRR